MRRPVTLGLLTALGIFVADRLSKYAILEIVELPARGQISLLPFLDLTMVWNRGVSFGMLQADDMTDRLLLAGFAALVVCGLLIWLYRNTQLLVSVALGGIIGGAVGNLYDRLAWGAVADFVDLHILDYHWYVFNLADAAITLGVAALIIDSFRGSPAKD